MVQFRSRQITKCLFDVGGKGKEAAVLQGRSMEEVNAAHLIHGHLAQLTTALNNQLLGSLATLGT